MIREYGGACKCCGESEVKFLAIDHVFNDGNLHRKEIGASGSRVYYWLKKNGYPKDRFQLLCHNCNIAKGHYGACPHQKMTQQLYLRNADCFATVDDGDYPALYWFKWYLTSDGHVARTQWIPTSKTRRKVYLHCQILDSDGSLLVDHKDGDPLNNTRANLRLCDHGQNARNRGKSKNISGFKGVTFLKRADRRRRYRAEIHVDGKHFILGHYETAEEAARVYDGAALALHGEFARLNFTPDRAIPYPPPKHEKSSTYRGVTKRKGGKWEARIGYRKKMICLGRFGSPEEAASAYEAARNKYYGN